MKDSHHRKKQRRGLIIDYMTGRLRKRKEIKEKTGPDRILPWEGNFRTKVLWNGIEEKKKRGFCYRISRRTP